MPIKDIKFTNVGPFDEVAFEFDEQVNVFIGPNNCGKSTVLMVLWEATRSYSPFDFPKKLLRTEDAAWKAHFQYDSFIEAFSAKLHRRAVNDSYFDILRGLGYIKFVPALRQSTDFRAEGPSVEPKLETLLQTFLQRTGSISTYHSLVKDEDIVRKIIELDYKAYREKKLSIRKVIDSIASIASEITEGFPLEFLRVEEDDEGLFPLFKTTDGELPLNCLSQGTQSIIQWLAHLLIGYAEYYDFPETLEDKPGILIIDEIDAHLHPSWQQRIIPTLIGRFPNLQIFFSTHSPLMLAGLRAGQVHLLHREGDGKVTVTRNEEDIVGWSADEILRSFMGVRSPTDLETAQGIARFQELRNREQLSPEEELELNSLKDKIHDNLLGGPVATQIEELMSILTRLQDEESSAPEVELAEGMYRKAESKHDVLRNDRREFE